MTNLIVLVPCFVLGIALRKSGRLPDGAHRTLNASVINVALPPPVPRYVHELRPDLALLFLAAMPWVMFALGTVFSAALGPAPGGRGKRPARRCLRAAWPTRPSSGCR